MATSKEESMRGRGGSPSAPQGQGTSLGTLGARQLTTTTKSPPQMQGITPRWLLRALPWVDVPGGTYRVNRRKSHAVTDGRLSFISLGERVQVIPQALCQLPPLRGLEDEELLGELASRFVQREYAPGELLAESGRSAEHLILIAHGKANKLGAGEFGEEILLDVIGDGDRVGDHVLFGVEERWRFSVKALTRCTVLLLERGACAELLRRSPVLQAQLEGYKEQAKKPQDKLGQARIAIAAGHSGEPELPGTFVDYESAPREYELGVAQTVLRVHTRVSDLFSDPMDQLEQQVRLTIATLRERQEFELINSLDFGLLHNVDMKQRLHTRGGPPTPDDLDEILCRRRRSRFFLAHPRAIAAFNRECSRRGIHPTSVEVEGARLTAWRGVPLLPCDKIPITGAGTTSILVMRTGADHQGVIGLRRTGLPDERKDEPGVTVRKMDINDRAVASYLVSTYFSAAVLVPDALGVLEDVEIGR